MRVLTLGVPRWPVGGLGLLALGERRGGRVEVRVWSRTGRRVGPDACEHFQNVLLPPQRLLPGGCQRILG
ncbi:hypothetical protein ABZ470_21400 [Streptosporangium sp. NPDC020072]|uniref:hypothetical protein n=1 Tax=Streptosporangium sp. NPDC020072 TaxID=3154788 RepID=UPI003438ECE7